MSEECGKVIRQVEASGDKKTKEKAKDDPVTIADLRVQKTLETNLNALYPTLRIIGEETAVSLENISSATEPSQITPDVRNLITTDFLNAKHRER